MPAALSHLRTDKRKRTRPMRSLSVTDARPGFCTLRMAFTDDYQRNPSAYSRALTGSWRPLREERYSAPATPVLGACEIAAAKALLHRTQQPPPPRRQPPPPPVALDPETKPYTTDELAREIFHLRPHTSTCSVKWTKAAPIDISEYPMAEHLAQAERECCSILRLLPTQYLDIKQALVRAGRTRPAGTFKKRDAQKLCRVDVNKTSRVFEWFSKLGWIPPAAPRAGSY
ncbi:hypothetical protein H4R18_000656 [Coemansia javaensis]|uniref:SWIRM domain-containing protein n=1 Tax=Coemansia javaensis TaxID=2761396 RepID=A0A9W8HHK2_9FUNG|nr:hypothetical protein H4R18_000656 [Coemansia javaensis]